jgi:flagellar hook-associated protein 3 FlgL
MSCGSVSGFVQSGLLAQLVANSEATQAEVDRLTEQSSSGNLAQTYGGLGGAAPVSLDLRPQMTEIKAWQQNIATANTQLDTTQSVLGQLHGIATSFSSSALGAAMESTADATALAAQASSALQQVVGLLNTQSNGQYCFAGTYSDSPPISTHFVDLFSQFSAPEVAALGTGTGEATVMNNLMIRGALTDYAYPGSNFNGTPPGLTTPVGQGRNVPTAFVAGIDSFAQQTSFFVDPTSDSIGSYVRDLITGLVGLAGLSNTTANESALQAYGADISKLLTGAATAMATDEAGFGQIQSELTAQGSSLSDTLTSLTRQVSGVEDADIAATATALSSAQTQLQASYKLIADMPDLSLVKYL